MKILDDHQIRRLYEGINLYTRTGLLKLVNSPVKMIYSKTIELITRLFSFSFQTEAKTFWGDKMVIIFPELTSLCIHRYGFYEEGLTLIILTYLKSGMVFFDIGSHYGYYSLLASTIVGDKGEVHAFEPTPSSFKVLKINVEKKGNIYPNNYAIWSENARISFKDFGTRFSAFNSYFNPKIRNKIARKLTVTQYRVKARSLDDYIQDVGVIPDFIKIDVEGAEYEIIEGMKNTLSRYKPIISLEVGGKNGEGNFRSRKLLRHLIEKNYDIFEYKHSILKKHNLKTIYEYDNLFLLPKG